MTVRQDNNRFDVVLIGGGLAASAAARMVALAGKSVAMIPGAGRSRSLDADGGLVDPALAEAAFGSGAPLGPVIRQRQRFTATDVGAAPVFDPVEEMPERRSFRRFELERWALDRAIDAGAVFLDGFVEGKVLPGVSDRLVLTEELGESSCSATKIVLCEGSDPRIAMRAGLRPDYPPEEQVHFARAIIARPPGPVVRAGRTRTSWGMPVGVTVVPLGGSTLVTVDSRIENVMRGAKSTMDALMDLLASRLGAELRLQGERIHSGIELSAMRSSGRALRLSLGNLLVGLDASGMPDMREIDRADKTLRSGLLLGRYLSRDSGASWDDAARALVTDIRAADPRWHASRGTGYIEESTVPAAAVKGLARLARGFRGRLRGRS